MANEEAASICSDFTVGLSFADMEGPRGVDDVPDVVTVEICFSEKPGFGIVTIRQTSDGTFIDTERLGLIHVKKYINSLLDNSITDLDDEPTNHRRYNWAMHRRCNGSCPVCLEGDEGEGGL